MSFLLTTGVLTTQLLRIGALHAALETLLDRSCLPVAVSSEARVETPAWSLRPTSSASSSSS